MLTKMEEEEMIEKFGKEYEDHMERTPRFIQRVRQND